MGLRFIFMLTRNDCTVPDAAAHLATALALGVRHIGFKDIGLPVPALKALNAAIKAKGATSYLEVVSLDRESELASARAAVEIGVDILLGGTHVDDVLPILAGTGIGYYPFPGRIVGHPSVLEGTVAEIAASARDLAGRAGVAGLDLLAYRADLPDIPALVAAACAAAGKPVIVAGSIADPGRIAAIRAAGAAGFTIGTAALDGDYPTAGPGPAAGPGPTADPGLEAQLAAIVRDVAELNGHLSPFGKKRLSDAFAEIPAQAAARVVGQVNEMPIRLVRLSGAGAWHFHPAGDLLLLVHRGRLLMRFRDREEVIDEGEFIVVPHGVEHSTVALTESCEAILLAPATVEEIGTPAPTGRGAP